MKKAVDMFLKKTEQNFLKISLEKSSTEYLVEFTKDPLDDFSKNPETFSKKSDDILQDILKKFELL